MTGLDWGQFLAIGVVTVVVAPLLGRYLAATFRGGPAPGDRVFLPVERLAYRFTGIDPDSSQTWKGYAIAVVAFGAVSTLFLYAVLLLQGVLPFNPTTPRGCPRPFPSTRPSVSSPAPTGRPTRAKPRPATSRRWPGWWSPSSPRPRSGSVWPWPSSEASPVALAPSATSGPTSRGAWCASSCPCR